jgi:hypothetical protein
MNAFAEMVLLDPNLENENGYGEVLLGQLE